jgi:hypothetical protein
MGVATAGSYGECQRNVPQIALASNNRRLQLIDIWYAKVGDS